MKCNSETFREHDTWDEGNPFDDYDVGPNEPDLPSRPYCRKCGKLKGSKNGRYYPDSPCQRCGSQDTMLRNSKGESIRLEKWVKIQSDKRDAELQAILAQEYGLESDYW